MLLDSLTLYYITNNFELKLDINKTKLFIVENIDLPIIVIMNDGKVVKHNIKATELFKSLSNTEMSNVNELDEIIKENDSFDILYAKTVKIRVSDKEEKFYNVSIKELKVNIFATYNLVVLEDSTNIKIIEKELEKITSLDVLTNIYNRESFMIEAKNMMDRYLPRGKKVAVFMLDLDHFKSVNDTYGHIIGDEFLIATSEILMNVVNPFGKVGRYGGEEFCGIVSCETESAVEYVLTHLRMSIEENFIKVNDNEMKNVTVSIGYVMCNMDDLDLKTLFKKADDALYIAKENGRNQSVLYSEEIFDETKVF